MITRILSLTLLASSVGCDVDDDMMMPMAESDDWAERSSAYIQSDRQDHAVVAWAEDELNMDLDRLHRDDRYIGLRISCSGALDRLHGYHTYFSEGGSDAAVARSFYQEGPSLLITVAGCLGLW